MHPTISIILPTYNRARFLPQALASIRGQQWTDWELIIVDDGSTDETAEIIGVLTAEIPQSVKFIRQENQGAYGARNTGLDHATGKYIAFFDSDDEWLPHHLADCVAALEANASVDWVYGASRIIHKSEGKVISKNCFFIGDIPRPFMHLATQVFGDLRVIDDPDAVRVAISHGLYCGLQCSVFRKRFFDGRAIPPHRIGEDRILPVIALKDCVRIGYLNAVHVVYHLHQDNTCVSGSQGNLEKSAAVFADLESAYLTVLNMANLDSPEKRAVRRRIQKELFWHLGYGVYQCAGLHQEAKNAYRRGLAYWPWDWRCWKTYVISQARSAVRGSIRLIGERF